MLTIVRILMLCFIGFSILTSCDRIDTNDCPLGVVLPEQDYEWLANTLEQLAIIDANQEYVISQYKYNGETVVMITDCSNCADALSEVKNCKGETICSFGGVAGLNTCPDFEGSAELVREIYP